MSNASTVAAVESLLASLDARELERLAVSIGEARRNEWVDKFPSTYAKGRETNPEYWIKNARQDLSVLVHRLGEVKTVSTEELLW
jgi:hypothetical protein